MIRLRSLRTDPLEETEHELLRVFRSAETKHEANERARPLLESLAHDPVFLRAVLQRYLSTPGALDRGHYPVVGIEIAVNPWFVLVANCWIPLPTRATDVSTKAIHHHGDLLLSTVTIHGPGYEHWMLTTPRLVDEGAGLYDMDLLEVAPHRRGNVSFVDAFVAHTPLYPEELSITLALWTSRHSVGWRDRAKRLSVFRGREAQLRRLALRLGLRKQLALKVVDSFDFYPTADGFRVMQEREEFSLGPNADHVCSVFHVLQETGNDHLGGTIRHALDRRLVTTGRPVVEDLLRRLERGEPIEGRLSPGHYGIATANFTSADIRTALAAGERRKKGLTAGGRELSS